MFRRAAMGAYPQNFEAISAKCETAGFSALTQPEQVIYCVWWLEGEVNNGGFHQYFLNSTGALYAETVRALKVIGANKTKAILERAAEIAFGSPPPTDRDERIDVLEMRGDELIEELSPLDDAFYRYEDDIEGLVNAYLSNGT